MQKTNSDNRRKLLGLVTVSGAAGVLNGWQKPVINSVILPAHAQTSVTAISCGSATGVDMGNDADQDLVVLSFVPGGSCLLTASQSSGEGFNQAAFGGNIIVALDAGSNPFVNWDTEVTGDTNWSVTPNLGNDNTNSGPVGLTATRLAAPGAGQVYNVSLSVNLSGTDMSNSTLVVSAVISPT